jgi:PAS domain S-box-containing protein
MTRTSSRHLPLSAIPVVVAALAILGGTAGLLLGVAEFERAAWQQASETSRWRLARSQMVLEAAFRRHDDAFIEEYVADLGTDPSIRRALLVDADNHVIASTRIADRGIAVPATLREIVDAGRRDGRATLLLRNADARIEGGIPIDAQPRRAVLVIVHDVGPQLRWAMSRALLLGGTYFLVLLLLALLIARRVRRFIARRTSDLATVARRIAAGDYDARVGLDVDDELAPIGEALDRMAERLAERLQALRRSEAGYRAVFEGAAEAIFVADASRRYEDANEKALALVGYSREELRALEITDLIPPEDRASRPARLDELRANRELVTQRRLLARDGTRIPVEIAARTLDDGRLISVVRDLRPSLEASELKERLASQERLASLGRLAASVGHEINNPLTYVLTNLDIAIEALADRPVAARDGEDVRELLTEAREGAERIRRIVSDLRIFTSTPPTTEAPEHVDIRAAIDVALHILGPTLRDRSVIDVRTDASLPAVQAHAGQLTQVLINLIENAAQAMPPGRPATANRIAITGTVANDAVVIAVVDNGDGVAPAARSRLFDPFFTTKAPGKGTGLGLAISRELVQRVGGHLDFDSEPGEGATFRIMLPIARDPHRELVGDGVAPPTALISTPSPHGPCHDDADRPSRPATPIGEGPWRLLIVDDDPIVARSLGTLVRGHTVATAFSPAEAIAALEKDDVDCILCDLAMPGGGGRHVFEYLQALRPELVDRFIFLTGGAQSVETIAFLEAAARPVLYKPIAARTLLDAIRGCLRRGGDPT